MKSVLWKVVLIKDCIYRPKEAYDLQLDVKMSFEI